MGIKCGIVGLPNVGKSTLFNALTAAAIPAENYPFCTIDPNVGVVVVPDPQLDAIAAIVGPEKVVPTVVEFVDIAGLVEGASQGEGLGNQFLSHIRETHAIAHLVRCFEEHDIDARRGQDRPVARHRDHRHGAHACRSRDGAKELPARRARGENQRESGGRASRRLPQGDAGARERAASARCRARSARGGRARDLHLLTAKPVMYIANVAEGSPADNPLVARVKDLAEKQGAEWVVISAALEAELAQLPQAERADFLSSLGLEEPGLNRVIRSAYRLLGLKTFYTAGPKEARAWTVPRDATAPEAAGAIHTDFQRGFIRAEVIGYDQFIARRGEQGAREAGELRLEGKTYVVQEGDVIYFRFNV